VVFVGWERRVWGHNDERGHNYERGDGMGRLECWLLTGREAADLEADDDDDRHRGGVA